MEYAREHGESSLDGKYRIISHRVSIKNVYWNGDDICEWGYDGRGELCLSQYEE